jgi:hypothetical protein
MESSLSAPGSPSQHSADEGVVTTDMSHGARLAERLATTEKREIVFAQSGEMTVTFWDDLPTEVRGVIERGGTRLFVRWAAAGLMRFLIDAWEESYSGGYDHATTYAWTCNNHACFLWKHDVSE